MSLTHSLSLAARARNEVVVFIRNQRRARYGNDQKLRVLMHDSIRQQRKSERVYVSSLLYVCAHPNLICNPSF
jgi:hypothetical protein